ncbi:B2 bradykinin receptor-like [Fundulus heteroclitus]|uniref:B2 bradykinin receptor-like n=1 Tax=Fundulus heteroclitus TaxID=8078 RepID=UPI00165BE036|nr:B2 bradykinin receptor-like [Fundulus heteroclitus]
MILHPPPGRGPVSERRKPVSRAKYQLRRALLFQKKKNCLAAGSACIPSNLTSWAGEGNQTNTSDCSLGSNNWTFTYVPVYVMAISVLGIALNIFVLMVFIFHKKPCSVPEIYLSNLAAADLLLVFFLPFWAVSAWKRFEWIFGSALCKMVNVGILMHFYCSIYFLVLVNIDRYLALVHPLSHKTIRRPKFAKISCLLVWILGFVLSVPKLINRELVPHDNIIKCAEKYDTIYATSEYILVFMLIIPISIIIFCTVKILQTLRSRFMEREKTKDKYKRATTLVRAVLLVFLICWLPFHLLRILSRLRSAGFLISCSSIITIYFCEQIFLYLAFFNSVLNPVLYVIAGKNFRKKVKEVFNHWNHWLLRSE